jgi:hypothetical protein
MKKTLLVLSALFIFCCSFSSTPLTAPAHSNNLPALPPNVLNMVEKLSPREFEKATGKKLRFKERVAYRILQWKLRGNHHEQIDERQRRQANLSLVFGIASVVFLFIPFLGILSPGLGIAAVVLGIMSLKGNTNAAGIVGIICGGLTVFLFLLAIAIISSIGWL